MRLIHSAINHSNKKGCDTKDDFILKLQRKVKLLEHRIKSLVEEVDHQMKEKEETAANSTKKRRRQLSSSVEHPAIKQF